MLSDAPNASLGRTSSRVVAGGRIRFSATAASLGLGAISAFVLGVSSVSSTSMAPTIRPNQHVVTLKLGYTSLLARWLPPALHRGNVLVLRKPRTTDQYVIKRAIAFGGDRVLITEGIVFLNGTPIVEAYVHHSSAQRRQMDNWPAGAEHHEVTIPQNSVFVLGDNRSESVDSRAWGPLPISDVVGKTVFCLPW